MKGLGNLESFVRSADAGSFSAAGRLLGLTPAAVSRNVHALEGHLGVRLFHRSTRRLTLTEAGARFYREASIGLQALQQAVNQVAGTGRAPAGVVKVSMAPAFGADYIVPLMPEFAARHPAVVPDLHFDNRPVDLVREGYDAAIGGGFDLASGFVARELARAHIIAVASPAYLARAGRPRTPADITQHDGILLRSPHTGRVRSWPWKDRNGRQADLTPRVRLLCNDPESVSRCAQLGMGIAFIATLNAVQHLRSGALERVLPDWHADIGPICLYFQGGGSLSRATRVFVDYVVEQCRARKLAAMLAAD